jgi:hypothetical protein
MLALMHISVDADELRKRARSGQIVLFVRIEDSTGHRYQTGGRAP